MIQLTWGDCQRVGEEIVALRIRGKGSVFQDVPVTGALVRRSRNGRRSRRNLKGAGSWPRRDRLRGLAVCVRGVFGRSVFQPGVQPEAAGRLQSAWGRGDHGPWVATFRGNGFTESGWEGLAGNSGVGVFCLSPQKGIVGIRAEGLTGNHRPMKRFFREVEAIWRRTLHRRSQKAGMFMPRFLRLLRRFPLQEPTILNPYRSVIQELTKNPHESRGSSGVKLYLFAGIGKKPHSDNAQKSDINGRPDRCQGEGDSQIRCR